jgi:predicted DNA-binding transcriptional regulator YafY
MSPSSTVHALYRLLNTGRHFTLDELSDELEVSRRHVRRLFKELGAEGLSIRSQRNGRVKEFFLAPEDQSPPSAAVDLTESELLALSVAADAAQTVLDRTPFAAPLDSAIDKVLGATTRHVVTFEPEHTPAHWHFTINGESHIDPDIFQLLTRAVRACETVSIDYHASSSGRFSEDRHIDPYLIARVGSAWLLTAYCHDRQRVLEFAIAAIESARGTGSYFKRPADFDPDLHYRDRFGAMNGDEVHVVRLHVDAEKAAHFQNKMYHPTQQIERTLPDGSLIASYEVAGLEEIAAFVRSWGPFVKAIAPNELADRIRKDLRLALHAYDSGALPKSGTHSKSGTES